MEAARIAAGHRLSKILRLLLACGARGRRSVCRLSNFALRHRARIWGAHARSATSGNLCLGPQRSAYTARRERSLHELILVLLSWLGAVGRQHVALVLFNADATNHLKALLIEDS